MCIQKPIRYISMKIKKAKRKSNLTLIPENRRKLMRRNKKRMQVIQIFHLKYFKNNVRKILSFQV